MTYKEITSKIKKAETLIFHAKLDLTKQQVHKKRKNNLLSETFGLLSPQKGKEFLRYVKQTRKQSQKKQEKLQKYWEMKKV